MINFRIHMTLTEQLVKYFVFTIYDYINLKYSI